MDRPLDLLIADDHMIAATAIKRLVNDALPDLHVELCPKPEQLRSLLLDRQPKVVVLSYGTPDLYLDVLGHTARLMNERPRVVLFGTGRIEVDWTSDLISASLPRNCGPAQLVETLRTLLEPAEEFVPIPMYLGSVEGIHEKALQLSPVQLAIGRLVAQGLSQKMIAERMRLGEGSVRSYITKAVRDLRLKDRHEFAAWTTAFFLVTARHKGRTN